MMMPWMQTRSGRLFRPFNHHPSDINIDDIANALAKICRFGGQCEPFYSVAEHCVHVSVMAEKAAGSLSRASIGLLALMHDAAEAYMGDVVSSYKARTSILQEAGTLESAMSFKDLEDNIMQAIGFKLHCSSTSLFDSPKDRLRAEQIVKDADMQVLGNEIVVIMPDPDPEIKDLQKDIPEPNDHIEPLHPQCEARDVFKVAAHQFKERYDMLRNTIKYERTKIREEAMKDKMFKTLQTCPGEDTASSLKKFDDLTPSLKSVIMQIPGWESSFCRLEIEHVDGRVTSVRLQEHVIEGETETPVTKFWIEIWGRENNWGRFRPGDEDMWWLSLERATKENMGANDGNEFRIVKEGTPLMSWDFDKQTWVGWDPRTDDELKYFIVEYYNGQEWCEVGLFFKDLPECKTFVPDNKHALYRIVVDSVPTCLWNFEDQSWADWDEAKVELLRAREGDPDSKKRMFVEAYDGKPDVSVVIEPDPKIKTGWTIQRTQEEGPEDWKVYMCSQYEKCRDYTPIPDGYKYRLCYDNEPRFVWARPIWMKIGSWNIKKQAVSTDFWTSEGYKNEVDCMAFTPGSQGPRSKYRIFEGDTHRYSWSWWEKRWMKPKETLPNEVSGDDEPF